MADPKLNQFYKMADGSNSAVKDVPAAKKIKMNIGTVDSIREQCGVFTLDADALTVLHDRMQLSTSLAAYLAFYEDTDGDKEFIFTEPPPLLDVTTATFPKAQFFGTVYNAECPALGESYARMFLCTDAVRQHCTLHPVGDLHPEDWSRNVSVLKPQMWQQLAQRRTDPAIGPMLLGPWLDWPCMIISDVYKWLAMPKYLINDLLSILQARIAKVSNEGNHHCGFTVVTGVTPEVVALEPSIWTNLVNPLQWITLKE